MANAEFKLDPRDGRFRLMEINGRCFLMQGLALAAGINYPHLAWREAVLREHTRVEPQRWDGIWLNLIDDVYHMLMFRRIEGLSLRQYVAPWSRSKAFAIWSPHDWRPFLMHCAYGVRKAGRMLLNSRYRAAVTGRVQAVETAAPGAGSGGAGASETLDE